MKRFIFRSIGQLGYYLSLFGLIYSSSPHSMAPKANWDQAVDHAVFRYGLKKEPRLIQIFEQAGLSYPPKEIALLAFKKEQIMQLWAKSKEKSWKFIRNYPLTASSGHLGPKLKEQDKQIPEGIYRITHLNPFSSMHLSMMLNYPNHYDKIHAREDGRSNLGSNIFVHGKSRSVGCLAVGDKAIDELFLLTRRVGVHHVKVIISPNDLRRHKPLTKTPFQPNWLPDLYQEIAKALNQFPLKNTRV